MECSNLKYAESPSALVAIIRAAKIAKDRELELGAKRELRERFGIELKFASEMGAKENQNDR